MPAANTVWRIAWGDYDFALDRQTLTYDLTETQTGTVWASGLSVGWMELESRATGERVRHDFAQAKLVSVAEKSSAQGKRLLLGLDLLGVPIDLYFICSQREIQLTVEASRDTRKYLVQDVGLLPGLVSVPDDGTSYLVLPSNQGSIIFAAQVQSEPKTYGIWKEAHMPFAGAVRCDKDVRDFRSAICLMTDSAYGMFTLSQDHLQGARLNTEFERDPERRRLDVQVLVTPKVNHVAIAQAYREKLINEHNHTTLRKKIKEQPQINALIGSAVIWMGTPTHEDSAEILSYFRTNFGVEQAQVIFGNLTGYSHDGALEPREVDHRLVETAESFGYRSLLPFYLLNNKETVQDIEHLSGSVQDVLFCDLTVGLDTSLENDDADHTEVPKRSRWEEMDWRLEKAKAAKLSFQSLGDLYWQGDWCASYVDVSHGQPPTSDELDRFFTGVPLSSICYHDSVVNSVMLSEDGKGLLPVLLSLSLPAFDASFGIEDWRNADFGFIERFYSLLSPLHRLTFSSFLIEHRFLTSDLAVVEAIYSDKTTIVVNQSETDAFERENLRLPPQGFHVRHFQMEAHYALRVGEQVFDTPAWRIRRARDGKRLEESEDVLYQEFPV